MKRMMVRFVVPGEPRGKQRPRVTKTGHAYTPSETVNYEKLVKACFWKEANKTGDPEGNRFRMTKGAVALNITAYYGIPKRASKERRKAMVNNDELPTKKPDLDNVVKIIMDGLNGQAYEDDKQVISLISDKHWADEPCVIVEVYVY